MSNVEFYDNTKPLIGPEHFHEHRDIADICIVTFSCKVLEDVLAKYECTEECYARTANGKIPIYSIVQDNRKILFYMSQIGSACAGTLMEEIHYMTGATKFIVFGSCGSLDNELTDGKFIVPTESYRDEGFSYHYQKASDYISIPNNDKLAELFDRISVPYVRGRSWTTDAIYRETEGKVSKRKSEGCICVEMESAGLQAVCTYRNLELYTFFFASDLVGGEVWQNINLGTTEEKKSQISCFDIAMKIVEFI